MNLLLKEPVQKYIVFLEGIFTCFTRILVKDNKKILFQNSEKDVQIWKGTYVSIEIGTDFNSPKFLGKKKFVL